MSNCTKTEHGSAADVLRYVTHVQQRGKHGEEWTRSRRPDIAALLDDLRREQRAHASEMESLERKLTDLLRERRSLDLTIMGLETLVPDAEALGEQMGGER